MAGAGLPIPKSGDVRTEPLSVIPGSVGSTAAAWQSIAASGEKIASEGAHYLAKEVHQAQVGQMASFEVDWRAKNVAARDTFARDPKGYAEWASSSAEGAIGDVPAWMVPHAKKFLSRQFDATHGQILSERRNLDYRRDAEQVNATITMDGSEVITAAAAGTLQSNGPNGEIVDPRIQKLITTLDAAVATDLMAPAKRDQILEEVVGKAHGETAARTGVQIYRETGGNYQAAVDHLKTSILENENLTLKPASRHAAFRAGLQAIDRERTADKIGRGELIQAGKDLSARITSGQPYDEAEVRDTASALGRAGAVAQQSKLVIEHTVRQETQGLGTRELAVAAVKNRVATARGTPEQAAAVTTTANNLGVSPRDLAAAISYETRGTFDPNIVGGKGNNHQGLIQFGPEERMKYGVRAGMTFEQQMTAVEGFLRDRGVMPGMGISEIYRTINGGNPNAPLNASDGNGTIGQHIERIQSAHYGNADKFLGGTGAIDTSEQSGQITKRVQQAFVAAARNTWNELKPTIDAGGPIEDDDLNAVQYAAALSGDQAWIKQTEELATARKIGTNMAAVPMAQRQSWIDEAKGQFGDTVNKSLQAQFDRQNKLVQNDPVSYFIKKGGKAPPPIDFANSANFRVGLAARSAIVQGVAAQEGISPGPALRPAELTPLKALLETASTDTKMALFADMATALPEPVYRATMEKLGNDTLTQFVGRVARERPELAREILRGNDLMSIDKSGDKSSLVRPAFQDKIGRDLYPNAGDQNNVTSAALALYTARRGTAGALYDPTDTDGIGKAIEDVAGKITKRNGVKVAIPPGMTESAFTGALANVTTEQLWQFGGAVDRNGNVFDPMFIGERAVLKQLGPGESNYVIGLADPTARDGFAPVLNGASMPLVIDMKALAASRSPTAGFVDPLSPYQRGRAASRAGQAARLEDARQQSLEAP